MTNILLWIDTYDLYGKVAVPKHHGPDEVPQIYRMVAASRGVFINPALTEPFGLTLLEAAASGLPLVATENGGPVDIIGNCGNGMLINPLDRQEISDALLEFLTDADAWQRASEKGMAGVRQYYTWKAHAEHYLQQVTALQGKYEPLPETHVPQGTVRYRDRAIITDLDQNLIGDAKALQTFSRLIGDNRRCVTFGVATGRRLDSALALIRKHKIPRPDVLISSLGTRIHYGQALTADDFWSDHIDSDWKPQRIKRLLATQPGLKLQPKHEQSYFKVSYYYDAREAPSIDRINTLLRQHEVTANVFHSFGQFLDVVPSRASKGQALRYVSHRLDIPLKQMLVAGGSGADEDMMRGNTLAVIVGNRHCEELSELSEDQERIFLAEKPFAAGIMEAADHYDFFRACTPPRR
jgi:sucrose-phosphate synthase